MLVLVARAFSYFLERGYAKHLREKNNNKFRVFLWTYIIFLRDKGVLRKATMSRNNNFNFNRYVN